MRSGEHRVADGERRHVIEEGAYRVTFCADDMSLHVGDDADVRRVPVPVDDSFESPPARRSECASDTRPPLDRLTLAVSNVCNLNCSYCYAGSGAYYGARERLMSPATAMRAVNRAALAYSDIAHVSFFGGEPTLNLGVVEMTCEYVRYLHAKGLLRRMPSFGITTNGFLIDERVMELLERYGFSVTLSLDGPKEIHDSRRRTPTGAGTYDVVARNATKLLQRGLKVEFECTYTADEYRDGVSVVDLMDFFHEEFSCAILHCQIVAAAPHAPEHVDSSATALLLGDAIEYSLINLARGVRNSMSVAVRWLNAMAHRIPVRFYCPAGRGEITVNADGQVYACFMLMQSPAFRFGSVNYPMQAAGPRRGVEAHVVQQLIDGADKWTNPACQRCWAQPLCFGCLGDDLRRHGKGLRRSEIPGEAAVCDGKRLLIDRFLRSIVRAHLFASLQSAG